MILPTLFLILFARLTESLNRGESCSLTHGSIGTCRLVYDCESVNDEVLAGGSPDTICGFKGDNPIVCCPHGSIITTTPSISNRRQVDNEGGEIARAKCAYYSQFVYTLEYSLHADTGTINVSQCAITSRELTASPQAEVKQFPYMVALGLDSEDGKIEWPCSGTLISETFVLTAAHCTHSQSVNHPKLEWARLGSSKLVDRADDKVGPVIRRIIERIIHPDFKPPAQYNDIALLRLESEVPLNGWIRPACLYTGPSTDVTEVIETVWNQLGSLPEDESNDLLRTKLSVMDDKTCKKRWNTSEPRLPHGIDVALSLCAMNKGNGTCSDNNGTPLVTYSNNKYYCMYDVVGVTSFGKLCWSNFSGIYTRVSNYVPWIESIVWPQG